MVLIWSDSAQKMVDELSSLIEMFHSFKKSGRSATLTMATKGGQATKVKLEVELDDANPSSLSSSPSPTPAPSLSGCQAAGDRVRPHGSVRRRAKANARAAQHRIFQALPFPGGFSDTQSPPDPPPSRRPLQHHPSPTVEGRRKILTVKKPAGCQPTFATLNLDGPPPPSPPPAPPSSMRPPLCYSNCAEIFGATGHCPDCGRCAFLCLDHNGCYCDPDKKEDDCRDICAVCECQVGVRRQYPTSMATST